MLKKPNKNLQSMTTPEGKYSSEDISMEFILPATVLLSRRHADGSDEVTEGRFSVTAGPTAMTAYVTVTMPGLDDRMTATFDATPPGTLMLSMDVDGDGTGISACMLRGEGQGGVEEDEGPPQWDDEGDDDGGEAITDIDLTVIGTAIPIPRAV